jgi:hypothetical protein
MSQESERQSKERRIRIKKNGVSGCNALTTNECVECRRDVQQDVCRRRVLKEEERNV